MSAPTSRENRTSVADRVVYALQNNGYVRGLMSTTRPENLENLMSLADQLVWAFNA